MEFKSIAFLKDYLSKNNLELTNEIPSDLIRDDRSYKINLVLENNYAKDYNLAININHIPPFVIISDSAGTPIDFIDLKRK